MSVSGGLYPSPFFRPLLAHLCASPFFVHCVRILSGHGSAVLYVCFRRIVSVAFLSSRIVHFSRIFARVLTSFIASGFYPDTAPPSCMSVSGGLYPSPFFRPLLAHLCASLFFVHCVRILSGHGSAGFQLSTINFQLSTFISLYICTYTYVYRLPYPFSPSFMPARYA